MKKTILLTITLISLLSGFNLAFGQSAIIRGQVTDAETGETLMQVNIVELDKNGRNLNGTVTDLNGNYIFEVEDINNDIQASFIGYELQKFKVDGRKEINIDLKPSSISLGDVTIKAEKMSNDGFIAVRDRATAVTRMEMEGMESVAGTTVEDMLQGRLGNVDITAVSGDPGAGLNIRIRGTASLGGENNPLIVVNGIPYEAKVNPDFDFGSADIEQFGQLIDVAPGDIEVIEVLKDAASTAIWGSRAANGVLMIKTKRGIKSKPMFDYTYKFNISKEPDPIPMLDGAGYARLITEEHYNVSYNEWESEEIAFNPEWEEYYNYSQNTNWIKEVTQLATTHQHDFSVRGGGDKSRYNISMSYADENGTTIGNDQKKLTLRSSLDYDLSTKIRFKSDVMYTRYDQTSNYRDVRGLAYTKMPNLSVYDRDTNNVHVGEFFIPKETLQGTATNSPNPVAMAKLGTRKTYRENSRALFTLNWNVTPRLVYTSTVTLDISDSKTVAFLPYKAIGYNYDDNSTNQSSNSFSKSSNIQTVNKAVYRADLGLDHELMVLGQFDTQSRISRNYGVETSRSASRFIDQPVNDKHLNSFSSSYSEYRGMGVFGTANYKFKDRYSMMAGVKYEGNSNFSPESRWGFFPTISSFWRISEEPFMAWATWMDDVKFRVSWGISGNSGGGGYHTTYSAGSQYAYMDMQGVVPDGPELTNLRWETIEQINPGLSFLGLNNRLNVEIDYYVKTTHDLSLRNSPIPSSSGFGSISQNNGEMENRGFEFSTSYKIIDNRAKDFRLSIDFNFSTNRNMVISMPENYYTKSEDSDEEGDGGGSGTLEYGDMLKNGEYRISVVPGEPIGGFFGYEYLGVYKTSEEAIVRDKDGNPVYGIGDENPMYMIMGGSSGYVFEGGDAKYKDQNHDGKIDELDLIYLGDLNPKFMGGANLNVNWKGFSFKALFNFKLGQKIINQTRMDTEKMYGYENQSKATNWRWRRDGDETDIPRALFNEGFNWLGSSRFVEDGSFLRLRTATLSYRLNKDLCDMLHLRGAYVYGTVYNIYTWTNYSGQDPDVGIPGSPSSLPKDSSKTPPGRRFMIGLNVSF